MSQENLENEEKMSRWHYELHPSVEMRLPRNALPGHFFHPTRTTLAHTLSAQELAWTSRDHRKNRHYTTAPTGYNRHGDSLMQKFGHLKRIEYWNISWWVAVVRSLPFY